ncbi:MAG: response regulator, partial [Pseudomonadota bacterium]
IRARETGWHIYILMLTIKEGKQDIVQGLDAGADDYVAKPYDPGELRARVDVGRRMVELQVKLAEQMRELQKALNEVKTLKGLVPICCHCKGIRDDKGFWNKIEKYILENTDAELTHGICPDCMNKLYPDASED